MNLLKIREVAKLKGLSIKILSVKIGMSETNLHKCIRDNKIMANDLEKIAQILDVPINIFFTTQKNEIDRNLIIELIKTIDTANQEIYKQIKFM